MLSLKDRLNKILARLSEEEKSMLKTRQDNLTPVYPFNEYEFTISTLLGLKKINLDEYYLMRDEYIARNMYLHIFEISAPRGFGELWAQGHLKELVADLVRPTKKIDPRYNGQYDFLLATDRGRFLTIEVKASRAVDFESKEPLYVKALSEQEKKPFDMNFQQIKPKCCDVFVWIGVWRDVIKYWVLSSNEVEQNKYYSTGQHRGNVGEGQLHLNRENIHEFDQYLIQADKLKTAIISAHGRHI